jgi:hypothetical protein
MPIGRGAFSQLLSPDLHRVFVETGKERPLEYVLVLNVEDMEWNPITDQQLSGLGTIPAKPEGSQFALDEPVLGNRVSYTATPFGMALEITWEMWRDELYGTMREMVGEMKRSSNYRQEVQGWSLFNNAFSTSFAGFTASTSLCSTAQTTFGPGGVTQANRPSPDIGLSITGIQSMILRFEGMLNERGLPRLMAPTKILIHQSNKFAAREILGSARRPFTADNELNALIEEDLSWMVCHYFTSNTQWFGIVNKGEHDLNFFWRDHPIFDSFDDPWTKNAIFTVYQRHTQGYGSWRGIDGSTG